MRQMFEEEKLEKTWRKCRLRNKIAIDRKRFRVKIKKCKAKSNGKQLEINGQMMKSNCLNVVTSWSETKMYI